MPEVEQTIAEAMEAKKDEFGRSGARAAGQQLDLLTGEPDLDFIPSSQKVNPDDAEASAREARRGRPKGSGNKRTIAFAEFIEKTIGSPGMFLAQWLRITPEEMARRLDISVAGAFDRQCELAEKLMKYCHAPLAAVGSDGKALPPAILMPVMQGASGAFDPDRAPWEYLQVSYEESEQNQPISSDGSAAPQVQTPQGYR